MEEVITEEVGTSQQLAALYGALAAAQGEFLPIEKNRDVTIDIKDKQTGAKKGSFQFRYADLEEITAKTRPALSKHGLATCQPIVRAGTATALRTMLVHKEGGMLVSEIPLPPSGGGDIKTYGAALTYLRRYAKSAILDVAADDDLDENGEAAGEPQAQQQQQKPEKRPALQPYSDEDLQKNLPAWRAAVAESKTTPERIIKMVCSKALLSPAQIKTITDLSEASA